MVSASQRDVITKGRGEKVLMCRKTADLRGTGSLPEEDGSTGREESEVVEERKYIAAGLMNGGYHCPPILRQLPQRLHHKISCRTA